MINTSIQTPAQRANSLDALRGIAILLMVLSGSIAFGGILPGWMYHAQVPPPAHQFKPGLPGITWVDMVFPFFLFAMGAAIPLALVKRSAVQPLWKTLLQIVQRYALLAFFSVFTMHARSWVMSAAPAFADQLLSICCFALLFLMYSYKQEWQGKAAVILKVSGFILATAFLALYPFKNGFSFNQNDIIIMVLANMALFASLIWLFTQHKPWLRIGLLPFVMAVFLSGKDTTTWNSILYNWSPMPWAYKFYYLKYLFIVLPGTLAGEWLLNFTLEAKTGRSTIDKGKNLWLLCLFCWLLLTGNLVGLYTRQLVANLFFTATVSALLVYWVKLQPDGAQKNLLTRFIHAGTYLLLLGLFFEAYEGGIKKDLSTYSYYFVTTGLAFTTLSSFTLMEQTPFFKPLIRFLADNGKNPMIAYTAGNLLLIPVLKITGGQKLLDIMGQQVAGAFLRGVIFTGIVSIITVYCTRKKLYWKT